MQDPWFPSPEPHSKWINNSDTVFVHIPEAHGNIGSKTIFCADIAKKYTVVISFISVASIQLCHYKIKGTFMTICKIMNITIFQSRKKKRYGVEIWGRHLRKNNELGKCEE